MNRPWAVLLFSACAGASATCPAFDSVKTAEKTYIGTIQSVSAVEVVIAKGVQAPERIPVNTIQMVRFDEEPALLNTARVAISAGRYADAAETLDRIDMGDVTREEIKTDVAFYKAYAAAKVALAEGTNDQIVAAADNLAAFADSHTGSFHYVEAYTAAGELYAAAGSYDKAEGAYGKIAKAPWPDVKMQAGVALGQVRLAQGNVQEALAAFQTVLATEAQGPLADRQKLAATLGQARCIAATAQSSEQIQQVVDSINRVILQTPSDQPELLAQAYNALGAAYRKAGRKQDALLAFLHVDVLYHRSARDHIEALRNLVELWNEVQQPERAAEATQILHERYNRSP